MLPSIKGGKAGSVQRLKEDMEKARSGTTWIRNLRAGEDLTVRFLTEPDDWYSYREHYSPDVYFFPCVGKENDCPGCHSDSEQVQQASKRYLANALDVSEGRVVPLRLPQDLANRLVARYERHGNTLMDRDYTLHRMGSGLQTTYDVTPEPEAPIDTDRYELIDPEQALIEQFEDAFGKGSSGQQQQDTDDGLDRDEEDPNPKEAKDPKSRSAMSQQTDDDIPSEPSSASEEDEDDGYLTEDQAMAMSRAQLFQLAEEFNVKTTANMKKADIVEAIFGTAGEPVE